jgi:hypothetical protein
MERRAFIATSIGLLAEPLAAGAQQTAKIARMGYLSTGGVSLKDETFFFKDYVTSVTSRAATS